MSETTKSGVDALRNDCVERRSHLSYRDFVEGFLNPLKPVILTDASREWIAARKWTPEFFVENFGDRTVQVEQHRTTVREYIGLALASTEDHPSPYARNLDILKEFPELLPDLLPPLKYTRPNWLYSRLLPRRMKTKLLELFIGGAGATFPFLHFDNFYMHGFNTQIYGEKDFTIFPPDQSKYLYRTGSSNLSAIRDLVNPDLERFPLYADARPIHFTLKAGETLFMPGGWWHTTRIRSLSISVLVGHANSSNWKHLKSYVTEVARERHGRAFSTIASLYFGVVGALHSFVDLLGTLPN